VSDLSWREAASLFFFLFTLSFLGLFWCAPPTKQYIAKLASNGGFSRRVSFNVY